MSFRPGGDDFNENNCRVSIRPLLQVLKSVKTVRSTLRDGPLYNILIN